MALEIERKWLIDANSLPFDLEQAKHHHIVQSYLSFSPQIRLRSLDDSEFVLTIKGKAASVGSNLAREEHEFAIEREAYLRLRAKTEGKTLEKTRYYLPHENGHCFEIDVYQGEFAGLAVAEMEFDSVEEAEAFENPSWVIKDISTDPYYRNVVMAQE